MSILKYLMKHITLELFLYTMPNDYIPLCALLWHFKLKYIFAFSCLFLSSSSTHFDHTFNYGM